MNIDKELAIQSTSYIFFQNSEILNYYFTNNEKQLEQKDYIQNEFLNKRDIIIVPSDSNCLIHAILVNLYNIDFNNFIVIITTLCSQYEFEINENLIIYNPNVADYFNQNMVFFSVFTQHVIRQIIRDNWCFYNSQHMYHKNPDLHMNNYAVDGLARNMLCKIFSIPELSVYQAFDDESRKKGIHKIYPNNIPQDSSGVTYFFNFEKYNIDVLSIDSRHYDALLK